MVPGAQRTRRGWSLTQRLTLALSIGAFFVAVLLGFLGADRGDRQLAARAAVAEREFAAALAERCAPLLERSDLMRLSVLTSVARDQAQGRVLVLDRAGRVLVMPDLSVPGHPEIFVAGDLASIQHEGKPVPGVAPAAKQMGRHVAQAIRARLQGRTTPPFRYRDFGNLATIGRMAAVVDVHGLRLSGLLAWWFWLAAHVFFLIGFRNRMVVLIDWAQAYWRYQRSARIILGANRGR